MNKTPIDQIAFDVDGTLVDSTGDIVKGVNFTLSKLGLREKSSKMIASFIGKGALELVRKSVGEENGDIVGEAFGIYVDYYKKHPAEESRLFPHVKEVLEYFRNKRKIIVTNRTRELAEVTLMQLGILGYFEEIAGADTEDCLKPSSCQMERVMKGRQVQKNRMLMVGDMDFDILMGKDFGMKTCWVSYGLGKYEDIKKLNPDFVLDDIIGLKEMIE